MPCEYGRLSAFHERLRSDPQDLEQDEGSKDACSLHTRFSWRDAGVSRWQRQSVYPIVETIGAGWKRRNTTFGELGDIVRANWQRFSDTFNIEKAFSKVMTNLNLLRAPIAHCSALAEDEVVRLRLTLADWFRLME